ncbi:hypothetical protein SETIT_8G023500v2 [Setaria italica]|uniref:Smr domain-containing protein n=1 Tax=Setaria italica TaxID=4555 RepID=K3ZL58_SETIT|nr:hypothetical protein SETIT_8G023500v2 [Setaria italica]
MEGKAAETCARAREMHSTLPEARHCNRLLRLLVERLRWEDARKLYDEMLAEEGGADNYSTCAMVRGMCLEGRVEEGMKLIEARWGAECIPHAVFYNVPARGHWEGIAFGGGESLDQLSKRRVSYLNMIADKHKGERVVVVSHGATIEEICRHANPMTTLVRRRIPNTSISEIHISGENGHWILEKLGDVGHINEDGFLQSAFGGDGKKTCCSALVRTAIQSATSSP